MTFFHHASHVLSREAKRLDRTWRRGTLVSALSKLSASSSVPFSFSLFTVALLGLDIEGLPWKQHALALLLIRNPVVAYWKYTAEGINMQPPGCSYAGL